MKRLCQKMVVGGDVQRPVADVAKQPQRGAPHSDHPQQPQINRRFVSCFGIFGLVIGFLWFIIGLKWLIKATGPPM